MSRIHPRTGETDVEQPDDVLPRGFEIVGGLLGRWPLLWSCIVHKTRISASGEVQNCRSWMTVLTVRLVDALPALCLLERGRHLGLGREHGQGRHGERVEVGVVGCEERVEVLPM